MAKVMLQATFAFICITLAYGQALGQSPTIGSTPPEVSLSGDDGGRVDGSSWSSAEIKGKVTTLFYVDPDEKGLNPEMEKALKEANLPETGYQSMAVINMGATWLPNAAISSNLKSKQKEFPRTIYVKDIKKALVKAWGLADDSYAVVNFDKNGQINFYKAGKLSEDDIKALLVAIKGGP